MQNAQTRTSVIGGLQNPRPPQRGYAVGPRSARFYGLSLSFHFGREAEIRRPTKAWRCFPRTVGAPRYLHGISYGPATSIPPLLSGLGADWNPRPRSDVFICHASE